MPPPPLVPPFVPPVPPLSPANQCKLYQIDCSRLQPMPFQNAAAPPICPEENVLVNCCRTRVPQKLPQKIAHVLRLARGSRLRICSQGFRFFFWEVSFCHSLLLGVLLTMSFLLPFYTLRLRLPPFLSLLFLINENYDSKDHLINDYSDVQGGGGGQFSSIHRRAAQAGTNLTQVIFVIALIFIITVIPIIVIIVIIVTIYDCLDPQMRNNFFENEDDSPLLVTSIDGISTQVSSSSSSS